jgi:hypothetical protein
MEMLGDVFRIVAVIFVLLVLKDMSNMLALIADALDRIANKDRDAARRASEARWESL